MTTEERLEKMEKKVKSNNRILLAVVLLAVLTITAGTAHRKDVIEARSFNVVDENGKTRIALFTDKDVPKLVMTDENGQTIWRAP